MKKSKDDWTFTLQVTPPQNVKGVDILLDGVLKDVATHADAVTFIDRFKDLAGSGRRLRRPKPGKGEVVVRKSGRTS